jgi:hypothetical protein
MLMHPTQFKGLEGFRPTFEHRLLFLKFDFNGMFNWPLYEKIVRTPYFAFPVFLLLPLTLVSSFGIILSALSITGTIRIFSSNRRLFIFLAAWFLPMYTLLSAMENWSNLKTTFLLLCVGPLIIVMCLGVQECLEGIGSRKYLIRVLCLIAILWSMVRLLALTDFPADPRWYVRFPRVLENKEISFIGDDLRTAPEDPADIKMQKNTLTQANLLPRIPRQNLDVSELKRKVVLEAKEDSLTTVDFWKYIYEH